MDNTLAQQLREAELSIAAAEKEFGSDSPELADRLLKYAALLRETDGRKLDVVNVEARAKAIRAKMYAAEAAKDTKPSVVIIKPKTATAAPATYIGLVALLVAMSSLFVDQTYFKFFAPLSAVLLLGDIAVAKASSWWRVGLSIVFLVCAWLSINSVPRTMLLHSSPMERFTYASENPEIVSQVRKLGKPVTVLSYQIALPPDYTLPVNDKKDWGRLIGWKSPTRADERYSEFFVMTVRPERDVAKKLPQMSLLQAARELAMPRVQEELALEDFTEDEPTFVEMNGFEFARIEFRGRTEDHTRHGFAYVAKEGRSLVTLVGIDWVPANEESLPALDAAVSTFTRVTAADDEDI